MSTMRLDGTTFARMLAGGAGNLGANSDEIDELNVFPVPDGDTGSNMTSTVNKGMSKIEALDASSSISEVSNLFSKGTVIGARGNSGVILSQIFKGIDMGLSDKADVDASDLAKAYEKGVKQSYSAVVNPTEGTILTVFREATEYAASKINAKTTIEDFYRLHLEQAKDTLARTKEMLPVLAEADVIDSGGAGYVAIAEGMYKALIDPNYRPEAVEIAKGPSAPSVDINAFTRDSVLEFGYCTELLIRLQSSKVDVDSFSTDVILDYLNSIGGESIVCFKDDDIVKIHVHTMNPGNVLNECRKYGEFLTVKIENMALQHEEILIKNTSKNSAVQKRKHLSVVAVALGEGMAEKFKELGADIIVDENPSTGDFLKAMNSVESDNYIVLPNDGNVVMAARQAAEIKEKDNCKVYVVPTKSAMEGYSALSIMTPDVPDLASLADDLSQTASNVISASVAHATRDADISGIRVKKGDYIAMYSKDRIVSDRSDKVQALLDLLKSVEDIDDMEILTVFCGNGVSEEDKERAKQTIEETWPDLQLDMFDGNQDIFCFIVGLE
ncbi:MAG: DAK2 domain-containing protein [Spirochaetales bacterium]|nr:DAK2 domain-containing protein [Spirochaetales bacterium]